MGRQGAVARCRVIVRGKVQGVGFRWFVRERARALGLAGRVQNRADGGVEIEAEGDQRSIDALMEHLRIGPPGAQVSGVDLLDPVAGGAKLPAPFAIDR
jgi:acylphosphatase